MKKKPLEQEELIGDFLLLFGKIIKEHPKLVNNNIIFFKELMESKERIINNLSELNKKYKTNFNPVCKLFKDEGLVETDITIFKKTKKGMKKRICTVYLSEDIEVWLNQKRL